MHRNALFTKLFMKLFKRNIIKVIFGCPKIRTQLHVLTVQYVAWLPMEVQRDKSMLMSN